MLLTPGQNVRVKPHTIYQHLSKGAVIDPPVERQHNGYLHATITAILDDGFGGEIVEVETPGGHVDLVAPEHVEVLLEWQWESLGFLAKLFKMDVSTLSRHAGDRLDARRSGKTWLSTRRAVREYLAGDGRRKENR